MKLVMVDDSETDRRPFRIAFSEGEA